MKAARLFGKEDLRVVDVPTPEIGPGEILLRVRSAHVCGTDIRMYKNGRSGHDGTEPLTPGHEVAGIIEETGSGVDGYEKGMPVAVAPNFGCGVCDTCVSGNTQMCFHSSALGVTIDGAFAEYVRIPEPAVRQGNVVVLPEGTSFAAAALAEPLSCVCNSFKRCHTGPGDTVLVIGAGPVGLMHARVHRLAGASRIIMNDINEARLSLCKSLEPGITTVRTATIREQISELTGGRGVTACITACPAPEAQQLALELVAVNGTVIFFGGLPHDREVVPINTNLIHYRQLNVTGTTRQSLSQYRKVLKLLAERRIIVDDLVTSRYDLDAVEAAYRYVMEGSGLKAEVVFSGA